MDKNQERGAALFTALLVVVLAATLVSGLLWRQEVRLKSLENQRLRDQMTWLGEGALDWARLILKEDLYQNRDVDYLGEIWAIPINETPLADFLKSQSFAGIGLDYDQGMFFAGQIIDANARFNLTSLVETNTLHNQLSGWTATQINREAVNILSRVFDSVGLDPRLAETVAQWMLVSHTNVSKDQDSPIPLYSVADLKRVIPSLSQEQLANLNRWLVVLPRPTAVNANTASAEVLSFVLGLSLEAAQQVVADRQQSYFTDYGTLSSRIRAQVPHWQEISERDITVKTDYFYVLEQVRKEDLVIHRQALIVRSSSMGTATHVLWQKVGFPSGITLAEGIL